MTEVAYLEPYPKEKNITQLSLFYFGKGRPKTTENTWQDSNGEYNLVCSCRYGVPGSFEQDVYTAAMRIWVKQGMESGKIEVTYSQIARELGLEPRSYVGQIKKSLAKLGQARYEFTRCFVKADKDGNHVVDTHFSLFDTVILYSHRKGESRPKKNAKTELIFPDIIRENLEAKYYQLLDMAWYRRLPEGLPRRLYEYLAKRRYHSLHNVLTISEESICRWLPIKDKNVTNRRKRLKRIAQALIDVGYLKGYQFDSKKKQCAYRYSNSQAILQENEANTQENQAVGSFPEAVTWLESIPGFHPQRKYEIVTLSEFLERYPAIRREYEAQKEPPGPAWVYKAFKEGWKFTSQLREEKEQQRKADRERAAQEIEAKRKKIKPGDTYGTWRVTSVEGFGILIAGEKPWEESAVPWN